jgi:large subunit ribosomal protein L16
VNKIIGKIVKAEEKMLSPKRTKYRKMQRGRMKGKACRNNRLVHGEYGSFRTCMVNVTTIEAVQNDYTLYKTNWKIVD